MENITNTSLREIINYISERNSGNYELGWLEFTKRYKNSIYQVVTRRVLSWNVPRLRRQLSDVVNDIVSEIFIILIKSIPTYREVDNEKQFLYWLTTVCNRATSHYLKKQFISTVTDFEIEDVREYFKVLQFDTRWELYESIVNQIRNMSGKNKRNLERDIGIFTLYTVSDFSQEMILHNPCFKDMGHRVIDNVVNRFRESLKNDKTFSV